MNECRWRCPCCDVEYISDDGSVIANASILQAAIDSHMADSRFCVTYQKIKAAQAEKESHDSSQG